MLRKLTHIIIILTLILFNVKCTNESLDLWDDRALNINSDEIGISNTSVEDTVTADIPRPDISNDYDTDEIVDEGGLLYELLNKVNSDYYKPKTPFEYHYGNDSTDLFIIANVGWKWYYNGTHINQHYFNSELAINKFDYISFPQKGGSVTIIIANDYETFSLYVSGYNATFVKDTYSFNSTSLYAGDSSHSYDGKEKKVFVYRIDVEPFITDDKDDYNDDIRRFAYAKWVCSIGNTPTSEFKIRCAQRTKQTKKIEILENIEY